MNNEFPEIGLQYEARQLTDKLASIMLDKSMPKSLKMEKMADFFIEWKELMGLTEAELIEEIRSLESITEEDIMSAINKRKEQYE